MNNEELYNIKMQSSEGVFKTSNIIDNILHNIYYFIL